MKLGITLEDEAGLKSNVSLHFGQCRYFLIVDIDDNTIVNAKVVPNDAQHGGGGCLAVDEILKYDIDHVIAGGMGMGAQQKFAQAGVKVSGYKGKAEDAVLSFLNSSLDNLGSCKEHGQCH